MPLKKSFTALSTSPAFAGAASPLGAAGSDAVAGALLDGAGSEAEVAVVSAADDEAAVDDPEALEPGSDRGSKARKAMSPARTSATRAAATQRPRPRRGPRSLSGPRAAGGGAAGGGATVAGR